LSEPPWCPDSLRRGGFTLIEVIGALVIFSVGVLMVVQLSGALGTQMRYSGAASELAGLAHERLDSLEAVPVASLTPGIFTDTLMVGGRTYERTVTVTTITPVLARIVVELESASGEGPSYDVTSYAAGSW
jgi:prepilin-type N-terminal cleavage/methylation domain-containing protein